MTDQEHVHFLVTHAKHFSNSTVQQNKTNYSTQLLLLNSLSRHICCCCSGCCHCYYSTTCYLGPIKLPNSPTRV